ncbi:MAG TPA: Ppx/GppA phosphatase family protein [Deltaproteobacteria bacterium]|nr:Ppx/GppA phosphatase family protein [Deltaproteobacteria bacterium]
MTEGDGSIISFIDMGTNSVRLMIVRIFPDGSHTILSRQKEMIRLGSGEFDRGYILQEAMDKAVTVCRHFVEMSASFHAQEIVAVATSATRDARNRKELIDRLRDEAGLDIKVISGGEEARLIYLGMIGGMNLNGRAFFIDIGGGSTEVIVGNEHGYEYLDSLKLGAIRLTTLYFPDQDGPVPMKKYHEVQEYVRNATVLSMKRIREYPFSRAFGCSGTIQSLAEIASHVFHGRDPKRLGLLSLEDLKAVAGLLCSKSLEERKALPGMNPRRADIIIGGAVILDTVMTELKIEKLGISAHELRDGLLLDYLHRMKHPGVDELSVRHKSVLALGRRCSFDESHAIKVARLCLDLFDSAKALALHDQGTIERELLYYAAHLHDVGTFLSYANHHANSYYFIRNADLLGFNFEELVTMAADAFFHRKAVPVEDIPEFASLDEKSRQIVRVHAIFLRLAESLDRSHAGLVERARFLGCENGSVVLEIQSSNNCQLEFWGVQNHREAFEQVFKKKLLFSIA